MGFEETFKQLEQNSPAVYQEAIRILTKIADNIIKNPSDLKVRTLQKSNITISSKILSIKGGKECLKLMGFEEKHSTFVINAHVPVKSVVDFKMAILSWKSIMEQKQISKAQTPILQTTAKTSNTGTSSNTEIIKKSTSAPTEKSSSLVVQAASTSSNTGSSNKTEKVIKKVNLPKLEHCYTHPFLKVLENYSHHVLQYEDKDLQDRTRNIIPVAKLEENAQKRLRVIQTHIKKNKLVDPDLSIQDMLILELLQWFKEEFFEWVDSPACEHCGGVTVFSHMSTDRELLRYTDRVELHRCKSCEKFTPFPRYNDPNILLETRRGRCGEWANTFTLCCRAMGWDARYVVEEGDHVWTEVYSIAQKRWLHCDPCENICDTPLIYESGWKKKISYVMAYSAENVQDVTWRYSSKHKEVCKRRKKCTEEQLLSAILKIREKLQKNLPQSRKSYLVRRTLLELVEFLHEKKPKDDELQGRSSGSEIWRLARGEIQETASSEYIWQINSEDIIDDTVTIRYSPSINKYEYSSGGKLLNSLNDWSSGAFKHESVFRKEEKDWKMVYIARIDGQEQGIVSWKFDLNNAKKTLDKIDVQFDHKTFEKGVVSVRICAADTCIMLPKGHTSISTADFKGAHDLTITATLSGGSWQHAQLFRQPLDSNEFSFSIIFKFK
ncbi:peptide-N(4)-(N-acetyl-beta-glucosaminyl)asparagine amidase isoform X1 [Diabrotica virgifera virgifera]|uniref:Peptide-N(4)-(N-acetyl-beta-glucosaminyl)asparagine amidase n=2 Tax=Diabrotica virgifera virgifera TaxID=50390 RepID=A0ABM5JLS5_DIAVI|nr:peptide-N(4)-(N-acetyl-beta-glucosaminyl)asparagine amidase isoform X1 [Diabrotica virgifera virgifera]